MKAVFSELLWIFTQLPDDYVVLETETTGLPEETGVPDIVSLGITVVRQREIQRPAEFMAGPNKPISTETQAIHGIGDAGALETFGSQCREILEYLKTQLVMIHNASFDWPILVDNLARAESSLLVIEGVVCSQKAAIPWARSIGCKRSCIDVLPRDAGVLNDVSTPSMIGVAGCRRITGGPRGIGGRALCLLASPYRGVACITAVGATLL